MSEQPVASPPPPTESPSTRSATWARIAKSTETPYPAWGFTTALLATFPKAAKTKGYRPARGSIIGFGFAHALGGYMILDGDLTNGSGFVSTWSALYLMVNGRAAVKQLRPGPAVLSGLAIFNMVYYGKHFFFPDPQAIL